MPRRNNDDANNERWARDHFNRPPARVVTHFPDGRKVDQSSRHAFDCDYQLHACDCPGPNWVNAQMRQPTVEISLHVLRMLEVCLTGLRIDTKNALALVREAKRRCK